MRWSPSFEFLWELLVEEKLPSASPPWDCVVEEALKHGVQGLLVARAQELGLSVPQGALDALREACAQATARNLEILAAWEEVGLGVPVKGLWLINQGFWRIWERPLSDGDLLVEDLNAALKRLLKSGFSFHARTKTGAVVKRGGVLLDLHETPFPPELRVPKLKGITPEFQALIIAVHLYKSLSSWGFRLVWFLDLKKTLSVVAAGALWRLAGSLGLRGALSGALRAPWLNIPEGRAGKAWAAVRAGWAWWLRMAFFKI